MKALRFSFLFLLLAAGLLVPYAFASAQVSITPRSLSACPCDPLYYDVTVYSDRDDVFNMQFASQYPFSNFMQQQIPVPAHSSIKTTLVINSACDSTAGNYSFQVSARGGDGYAAYEGYAVIKSCNNLEISMPAQQSVCSGSSQSVQIALRNSGLVHESGTLAFDNLPKQFYYLLNDSFDLEPGKSKSFLLSIQPPSDTPPSSFTYSVRANNARAVAGLEIQSCSFNEPAKAVITPLADQVSFCAGTRRTVSFQIRNLGETATFDLTSSGVPGSLNPTRVTVSKGGTRTIEFNVNAESLTPSNRTLTVNAFGPSSSASASVKIVLNDCPNAVFGDLELCLGDSGSIPFSLKNSNNVVQQYEFRAFAEIPASVTPSSAVLGSNQAVAASLSVTGSALGTYPVQVFANQTLLRVPKIIVKTCNAPEGNPSFENKTFLGEAGVIGAYSLDTGITLSNASIGLPGSLFQVFEVGVQGTRILFRARPLSEGRFSVPALISVNGRGPFRQPLEFTVTRPNVEIREKSQQTFSDNNGSLENEIVLSVLNKGNSTVSLTPSSSVQGASFDQSPLVLAAGEQKDLTARFKANANDTVFFSLSSNDRSYGLETRAVQAPSSSTGFFTAARAVGLFTAMVVIVILALAFVLRKQFTGENGVEDKPEAESAKKPKK